MVEQGDNLEERILKAREELKEQQGKELKSNTMILYKDKEILKLREELEDIEQQIKLNKACYSKNNTNSVLIHPLVNYEFELLRNEIIDVSERIANLTLENNLKKQSETNSNYIGDLVSHLEYNNSILKADLSPNNIEKLTDDLRKNLDYMHELETNVKDRRELIAHLKEEISYMQDASSILQNKIDACDHESEAIKKDSVKLPVRDHKKKATARN